MTASWKQKEAKQGNYIYSGGQAGETGKIHYQKEGICWEQREERVQLLFKVHKEENEDLPKHLKKKKMHIPFQDSTRKLSQDEPSSATYRSQTDPEIKFQTKESNKDANVGICVSPWPNIDSTLTQQMTQNYLQAAKTCFQSSNVVEITVETAKEFASTSNNWMVNSSTNMNSIKSTV